MAYSVPINRDADIILLKRPVPVVCFIAAAAFNGSVHLLIKKPKELHSFYQHDHYSCALAS